MNILFILISITQRKNVFNIWCICSSLSENEYLFFKKMMSNTKVLGNILFMTQ